jgi:hypothetical protein
MTWPYALGGWCLVAVILAVPACFFFRGAKGRDKKPTHQIGASE